MDITASTLFAQAMASFTTETLTMGTRSKHVTLSLCLALAPRAAVLGLAGCSIGLPSSAEIDGSGVSALPQSQTASCGTFATLDRYVAGSGSAQIQVTDGSGHSVYDQPAEITGEINDSQQLTGVAGTWTLAVAGDLSGQWKFTLECP
jgi:hypothetical protein